MKSWLDEMNRRNVVRVGIAYVAMAWLVLQFADLVLENVNAPDWVMQALMLTLLLGLPFVLVFSWAFELTPEGIKTTGAVDRSESITHNTGRRLDRAIIVALVVALGYFVWDRFDTRAPNVALTKNDPAVEASANGIAPRSIAVLPFVNMSGRESENWFADGLTEEILNALARVPDLLVSARTSSFAFRASDESVPVIAGKLGVANVLEGSVRRSGDRLRITVKLIRASDGFTLWAEDYDREYADVIITQENIAYEIARALKTAANPEQLTQFVSSGTDSIAAYEAYLRGGAAFVSAVGKGSDAEILRSKAAHETAVRLDPNFAAAYARLANFWRNQSNTALINSGITGLSRVQALEQFEVNIAKAIELEASRSRRLYYRSLRAQVRFEFSDALTLLKAYLADYPNDRGALQIKLRLLTELGLYEEAGELIWEMEERGVMDASLMVFSLIAIRYLDDPPQTRRLVELAMQRYSDMDLVLYVVHRARLELGEFGEAEELLTLIDAGDMPRFTYYFAALRQACAESRLDDARALYLAGLATNTITDARAWLFHTIMGKDEVAYNLLRRFDNDQNLGVLTGLLLYAHFDHRRFPYMQERLGDELATRGEPRQLPYRCSSVAGK